MRFFCLCVPSKSIICIKLSTSLKYISGIYIKLLVLLLFGKSELLLGCGKLTEQ